MREGSGVARRLRGTTPRDSVVRVRVSPSPLHTRSCPPADRTVPDKGRGSKPVCGITARLLLRYLWTHRCPGPEDRFFRAVGRALCDMSAPTQRSAQLSVREWAVMEASRLLKGRPEMTCSDAARRAVRRAPGMRAAAEYPRSCQRVVSILTSSQAMPPRSPHARPRLHRMRRASRVSDRG